ncbi:MAG: TetR/AcrR family transcriptional regulator [Verrucomicrobiota bacterium]
MGRYREQVLETGHAPASVYAFTKSFGASERDFFEQFASFEALESAIWRTAVEETIAKVQEPEDWEAFTAQQKLLTFYFAFTDQILNQRSFFLARFPRSDGRCGWPPKHLHGMRDAFVTFAKSTVDTGMERDEIVCRGPLTRGYPQGLFLHFLTVIDFNLNDDSSAFERTDAFIEKSMRLAFDLIGTQAIDSAADLVRFLFRRKG